MNTTYVQNILEQLCRTAGVNGLSDISQTAKKLLQDYTDQIDMDTVGNIIATIPAKEKDAPVIVLEAHMDEIGFIVTSIDNNGFISVSPCGGVDRRILQNQPVTVWGKTPIKGVFCSTPPHLLQADEENKAPGADALYLDVGLNEIAAKDMISIGSKVSFAEKFTVLHNTRVTSKALDNRAGMAAVLYCLYKLKNKDLPYTLKILFSIGEELGCRGAVSGAFLQNATGAIVTDVSFAHTPDSKAENCGKLGKGVMIGISPTLDQNLSLKAIEIAQKQQILYQTEVMGGKTGTDADVISVSRSGVKTMLLSIPLKYMHTPIELIDMKDICTVGELMAALLEKEVF